MTSPLYTEESSSETAMEGSLEVFWAETIEPENTPIEIFVIIPLNFLSSNRSYFQ